MAIDIEILKEVKKKSKLYDAAKEQVAARIRDGIRVAIEKLKAAERELLDEVGIEFEDNPFAEFLGRVSSDGNPTDEETKEILAREISNGFGPDEESLSSLFKEIESFKTWRKKKNAKSEKDEKNEKSRVNYFDLIPKNLRCTNVTYNKITLAWDEVKCDCFYEIELKSLPTIKNIYKSLKPKCVICDLKPETEYYIRIRISDPQSIINYIWSNPVMVKTEPYFPECSWKECPDNVRSGKRYFIDKKNPKIAVKPRDNKTYCTIVGNASLPPNKVTSWSIKILKSKNNGGDYIFVGVAPFDINQNEDENYDKCGWYFYCCDSTLWSGLPHNYVKKEYGPRKEIGQYVHTGDVVGVMMDTIKGDLSFVLNGVNLGIVYSGIPLDKPLIPCVLLRFNGDSVELDPSEVEENVDSSISIPKNITSKYGATWDSITLTWDTVEGASFYQVEVDDSIHEIIKANTFTKAGFLPETEHSFRVRTMKESSVSEWSDIIKGKTQKGSFETSAWKKCPDDVKLERRYLVNSNNSRIVTCTNNNNNCTIIGNVSLPLNKVTSLTIKILKSCNNDGSYISVGIAPFDIDQNEDNLSKCGWYFNCYGSGLWSGPPRNYVGKEYGPRKELGKYVHTGDSVGVVMDTIKGELSYVLNGVNYGVAYEGIPLDKPLVPCVLLGKEGDSVELII